MPKRPSISKTQKSLDRVSRQIKAPSLLGLGTGQLHMHVRWALRVRSRHAFSRELSVTFIVIACSTDISNASSVVQSPAGSAAAPDGAAEP